MTELESLIKKTLNNLDKVSYKKIFIDQEEALIIENFLPEKIQRKIISALPMLEENINRNYLPKHKKSGSVSCYDLDKKIPIIAQLYQSKKPRYFLEHLSERVLLDCPEKDPHTYALYYYTEEGSRYTLLFGLVDKSSCILECQLYKNDPKRETQQIDIQLTPSTLVFFNGDKLWHRVTPLGENERRMALTMEFLTNAQMSSFGRFISNMKDSIAYFGFRQIFIKK